MASTKNLTMPSGYCFLFNEKTDGEANGTWNRSSSEPWEEEVYSPTGKERLVGSRYIDGCLCRVFLCPDGSYRAVHRLACV